MPAQNTSEKKRIILDAAAKVFAQKGYHRCRVSDIAREAGIAYGLVYHYFKSKEEVLHSIFQEKWALFAEIVRQLHGEEKSAKEKLSEIISFLISIFKENPELMEVMILEVGRSSKLVENPDLETLLKAIVGIEQIIVEGQNAGELKKDIDPLLASYILLGSLETLFTGYILETFTLKHEDFEKKSKEIIERVILEGMSA